MFIPVAPQILNPKNEEEQILFNKGVVLNMQGVKRSDIKTVCEKLDASTYKMEDCLNQFIPANAEILSIQFMPCKVEYGRVQEVMMIASYKK